MNPKMDINTHEDLLSAVRLLLSEDQCDGKFVFGRKIALKSSNITTAASKAPGMVLKRGNTTGQPCGSKKFAEKDAAAEALQWLAGESGIHTDREDIDDHISILQKPRKKKHKRTK
ncbi:hypothetical protein BVC80_869g46 [Macleaya cordata]|uniref:DRBM domain-containing protein n=1 Tax=Macleaya cordata TaxID=56857 RepID=A0A200Q368_MACCD|nr:hypothetical protein BVC80_869g46 [Macleaya cordata]